MVQRLLVWEAWWVSPVPADRRGGGRAAVRFAAGVAPWGLLFAATFAALHQPVLAVSLLVAGLGVGSVPAVLRSTGSVDLAAHWMNAFLAQSLLVSSWSLGGLLAASFPWLGVCVVTAAFLSGPRAGALWTAISVASAVGLLAMHLAGAVPPEPVPPQVIWGLAAAAHSGLFASVLVFVWAAAAINARSQADLEQAVAVALAANTAKSEFLTRMSHELRTPMNAVIGYAELLMEDAPPADQHDLARIQVAGRHLLQLINEVLDLAKVDAGQMQFTSASVDAVALARDVLESASPLIQARGNRAELEAPADQWVRADPMRLQQCLLNLVSNAAKFTEHGLIRIRVHPDAEGATISVEDTGTGIAADQLQRIFEPFTQASPEIQRTHGGTGLGLALVRQFMDRMGGRVWVESRLGGGSTFHLTLASADPPLASTRGIA